jgi:hypothetical protein
MKCDVCGRALVHWYWMSESVGWVRLYQDPLSLERMMKVGYIIRESLTRPTDEPTQEEKKRFSDFLHTIEWCPKCGRAPTEAENPNGYPTRAVLHDLCDS